VSGGGKMMTAEAEADKQVVNSQTDRLTNRTGGDGRGEGVWCQANKSGLVTAGDLVAARSW
jgi:hypothetical protein